MTFRIKDLMIHVLPSSGGAAAGGQYAITCGGVTCGNGWTCGWTGLMMQQPMGMHPGNANSGCFCVPCSFPTCRPHTPCAFSLMATDAPGAIESSSLPALKEQLKQALAELEQVESVLAQQEKPKTVEDIDQLEKKLLEGVEELRAMKREMQERKD